MNFIVLFSVPYDAWEVMLVTNDIEKAIDKIINTKANCIQFWENEKLINDYNFTEEWDYDSTYEYEKALNDDILNFMNLINKINRLKQLRLELKYVKEKLRKEDNSLKVGIVLTGKDTEYLIKDFLDIIDNFIHDDGYFGIISSKINKDSAIILTDKATYELIKLQDSTKGKRFHKILYNECDNKLINEILIPMASLGEQIGIHNTVEKL